MLTRFIGFVVTILALVGVSVPAHAQNGSVSLPTSWIDTTYPTQSGTTRTVCSSGCTHSSLQSAIDAAVPGDTISLAPGSVHGNVTLRGNKPDNGRWIVIRSSSPAFDPGGMLQPGVRVDGANSQHLAQMAQIRSPSSAFAIDTEFGAHHYRIVGLDIASSDSSAGLQTFIELGHATSATPGARDIVIDRVFIHGRPSGSFRRGVSMNGARLALIDSQVMEIHDNGGNENAVGVWNGPGPIKIVNNRLEAAGIIVMFGGSDPGAAAMNPADLEFRGNLVSRPLAWRNLYWVRNLFELKNLNRALVEGNIFENNWFSGQKGHALLFTVRNQDGNCPTCTVQDITLRNNIVRNAPTAVSILGADDLNPSGYTGDLLFTNNIFDNIDYSTFADFGTAHTILITDGPRYVTFERNTFINQANFGGMIAFSGNTTTGFVFRKNLMRAQQYGVLGDNASPGTGALDAFAPGWTFELNGIAGSSATHPANNQYLSTTSWESQFVRYNGGQNGDYRLTTPNAYASAGITDAGADVTAVLAATACTISGNCAGSSVPSSPDPVPPAAGGVSAAGPWTDQGIGNTGQSGSSGYAAGTFTLSAAGADIWGSSDDFRYVYETLEWRRPDCRARHEYPEHAHLRQGRRHDSRIAQRQRPACDARCRSRRRRGVDDASGHRRRNVLSRRHQSAGSSLAPTDARRLDDDRRSVKQRDHVDAARQYDAGARAAGVYRFAGMQPRRRDVEHRDIRQRVGHGGVGTGTNRHPLICRRARYTASGALPATRPRPAERS